MTSGSTVIVLLVGYVMYKVTKELKYIRTCNGMPFG